MKLRYEKQLESFALALLTLVLLSMSVNAQPERADALFAEAKKHAAGETIEQIERSFPKFEEAAKLYKAAGNRSKTDEVELEYGRKLRRLGVRERDAKRFDHALAYFSRQGG